MTMPARANVQQPTPAAVEAAGRLLQGGALVAFPTETVYGLGGDATNDRAVARIFEAKGRPSFNPLIVHVLDRAAAARWADIPEAAASLIEAFWPGGLTLVLPRREAGISRLATAGLDTVAIRCPAHPVARALLAAADRPIAAPSANRSGDVSPTTADHVAASLGNAAAMILDGGSCPVGIESTILDMSESPPRILRPGAVPREDIEAIAGAVETGPVEGIKAPGMLTRHYAPGRPVRLNATDPGPDEALLAFGPDVPSGAAVTLNLSETGDLVEAAANLFAYLHTLDRGPHRGIAVMPVPEEGLGVAINDRLRRAATPLGA